MELWEEDEPAIRRYLLGCATAKEAERIQVSVMLDPAFAEGVEVIEGELIDEYVWEELRGRERLAFVRKYLSVPLLSRRVLFAEALRRFIVSRGGVGRAPESVGSP